MPTSSSFALQKQVEPKEEEHMFLVSTNLLQAGFDKDRVHSDRGDYMFVGQDGLQLRICGHNLSHNIVHSYYFGNFAFLHVVQDRLQAQSTSRMAFCQEREDDENMTCMRMAILGDWHEDKGDQQNFPSRKGGTKLIWFESTSWRPKTTQVRAHLGV